MKHWAIQVVFGVLVLAVGVLLLLEAAGFPPGSPLVWAGLLAAGSVAFWYVFFTHRPSWWAAIPGAALLGAAAVPVMELDPGGVGQWTEVQFLAALSAGFWAVYLHDHHRWWALIPGGTLLTLAIVTGVTAAVEGPVTGAIVLFGLAATFTLVAVLPPSPSRRWWAWIPAAVLAAAGLLVLMQAAEWLMLLNYVWPLAIIGGGAFLVWRAVQRRVPTGQGPTQTEIAPTETTIS